MMLLLPRQEFTDRVTDPKKMKFTPAEITEAMAGLKDIPRPAPPVSVTVGKRLVRAAREAAAMAKHGVTATTRTAEELENLLGLPAGAIQERYERMARKRAYMKKYMREYRKRK